MKSKVLRRLSSVVVAAMLVGSVPAFALAEEAQVISAQLNDEQSIVHFVNSSDTSKLSAMASYISNAKSYVKDGVTYLRMDVQQVYDVKITVEGQEGVKVGEYVATVEGRGGAQEVTFFTIDYAVKDATAIIEAEASYFVPNVFTEPQVHGLFVVLGNDINVAKAELDATIEAAKEVEAPSAAVTTALAAAEKVNNYVTKKADLEAALKTLKTALAENPAAAQVYFVNESDPSKLSAMANYIANPKTYTKDGVTYLRLDVQQVYDVKVLIEDKEGTKAGEYVTTVVGRGGPEQVTMFTFDYALTDATAVIKGSASYFVPGVFTEPQAHDLDIVIGHNVDAEKAQLAKALNVAGKVEEPSAALITAIQQATAANSYLKTNEEIAAATAQLVQEVAKQVSFSDVNEHWAKATIQEAVASGIAEGYVDGSFKPNQQVTRAEFTKLIASALNLPAASGELTFSDKDSIQAWALPFVQQSVQAGIINGYEDGTFKANNNITRSEMAVMVVKALDLELEEAATLEFTDNDSIPAYAKPYVATAVKHGLIEGLGDGSFGGKHTATRAQAVTIIVRAAN